MHTNHARYYKNVKQINKQTTFIPHTYNRQHTEQLLTQCYRINLINSRYKYQKNNYGLYTTQLLWSSKTPD